MKDYYEIPLTMGLVAKVDPEDYERVSKYRWCAQIGRRRCGPDVYYAKNGKVRICGKWVITLMHRYIMRLSRGDKREVDHINGNGLDNRRCNLRIVSKSQNGVNQSYTIGSSRYKGVSWYKRRKRWVAYITKDYKRICIGYYNNEKEAAIARDKKALELFGRVAKLNLPEVVINEEG